MLYPIRDCDSTQANLSAILWYAHDFDRAIEHGRNVLKFFPQYARAYEDLGRTYESAGRLDEAMETFRRALTIEDSPGTRASLACALAGQTEEAQRIEGELHELAKTTFVSAYSFALICLGLGRLDEAFRWLDQAYDERSSSMPFLKTNPRFDSLRGDPRLKKLLLRLRVA